MSDVIITKALLIDGMGACDVGPTFIEENNLWGRPDESVICPALREAGLGDAADWWLDQKKTEKFVRLNGSVFTMGTTYQVFNPLTGQHTKHETESSAKDAIQEIYQQILDSNNVTVCQTLNNENGDSTWISVNIITSKQVTVV